MGSQQNSAIVNLPNLILIGPQGSGKGTQARVIIDKFGYELFASGDLLRQIASQDSPLGHHIKELIDSGVYIPDEELFEVFRDRLSRLNHDQLIIFDGLPRTLNQAMQLNQILTDLQINLPRVIYIKISRETALNRLLNRKICVNCQTPYLPGDKSYETGICVKCGGQVQTRPDDNSQSINNRLDQYFHQTDPILNYYRADNRLIEINGEPPIPDVSNQIIHTLENYHD